MILVLYQFVIQTITDKIMKTANCTLEVVTTKKKATLHIYIERTSDEIFNMGNSSFLVNLSKTIFSNGRMTFSARKYSSKGYEAMEFVKYPFSAFGVQIRCNTLGREVTEKKTKVATIVYDYTGNPSNISWRLIDTAVVTPNYETVDTRFLLTFKQ